MKEEIKSKEYEKCVVCGCTTHIPVATPVEMRDYYVSGAGQLCQNCYKRIYGDNIKNK